MGSWRRNWGYKLVSVLLAVLLWLLVSNQMRAENAQQVIPLQEKNVPGNLVVTSKLLSGVTVRLQGALNPSIVKDMVAYVDLSHAEKGEKSYPVTVPLPAGVRLVSVEPSNVTVSLDELKEETFTVSLISQGKAAEGFEIGKPIIRPSTITIRGPEQNLRTIDQVFVEINLANATETIQTSAALRFKDNKGNPIAGNDPIRPTIISQPEEVSVVIPVLRKDLASKTLPVRVQTKGNPAPGLLVGQISSTPGMIKIYGPPEKLKGIDFLNGGTIDVSGATQEMLVEIKPENLGLPAGVSLEPGVKINVLVGFVAAPVERVIKAVPISMKNLSAGLQAEIAPAPALDITVKGPADVVNNVKDTDISLWVDLTGLSPGQQTVPVFMQLPPGVSAQELPKAQVTIK